MNPDSPPVSPGGPAPTILRGRYELGERIAQSAFYLIHEGRDREQSRPVAIRILRAEYAADQAFAAKLLAEAQSATSIKHPNVAQVYEAWMERGTVIIASEWVRGITLQERITRVAPFPLPVATDICLACAEALHHAHEAGYVHGDMRPDIVMITPDGRVKLTDFGLGASVIASWKSQLNALGSAAYYQAPEVIEGRPPSAQSDIYSLGCMYFEMLSGGVPFKADTPVAIAARHLNQPPPVLSSLIPEIPNAISGIALKCMQKNPRDRYTTAERLIRDLHSVRDALRTGGSLAWTPIPVMPSSEPAAAASRTRGVRVSSPPVRREPEQRYEDGGPSWKLIAVLAVVILSLIGGFFGLGMFITRTPDQVTLPLDLVGMPEARAASVIRQLGLVPEIRKSYHDRTPEGTVYDTSPRPGAETRAGKSVSLFVSQGVQPATVPDVVGRELATAQRELQAAGFSLGETKEEFSEVIPKGEVMSQSPLGGSTAGKKSAVSLSVSKGKEPIPPTQPVDVIPGDQEPPVEPPATTPTTEPGPPREMEVAFPISGRASGAQRVRIVVRGEGGEEETQYEEEHQPGDQVRHTVTIHGAPGKSQIRVYLNDRLIHRESR